MIALTYESNDTLNNSDLGCDFNRSMQHLTSNQREEDVADEETPKKASTFQRHILLGRNFIKLINCE